MCGIVGIFHPGAGAPVASALLSAMADTLRHRGPDDSGFFTGRGIGLGFRRLSIIDLTTGNQPMFSADGSVVSICNGEIYNYQELRRHLEARGHRFRTLSDTEVLPALYLEFGPDFVTRLNGQFAFALYDKRRRRLMLARDHVGIAPLFYTTEAGGAVVFGSEIKALLKHPGVSRRVDLTGLDQILTFPGPVSPHTVFAGISSLPPGHRLLIDAGGRTLEPYWDLDYPPLEQAETGRPLADCLEELDEALRRAVRYRLQADVPVGVYVSGGLDSSLIAALVGRLSPAVQRHSFSIGFTDHAIDERRYQRLMASRLGTLHHETEIGPAAICNRLHDIVVHAEAPLRESYDACSLILSGMVHDAGLKVVLTGEGADELFAGYVGYRLDRRRLAEEEDPLDLEAMLEAQLRERLWGDPQFFYEKTYHAHGELKAVLYAAAVRERFGEFDCLARPPVDRAKLAGRHHIHKRSYLDFKLRMADHLLADHGDRVALANSVEARYPFLDIDVIDAVRRIPPSLMLHGDQEKYVLKQLARRYLPSEIVDRQKFSFVAPGSPELLRQKLPWVEDLLSYDRIKRQGYFDPDTVEHLKKTYRAPGFHVNQTFDDDLLMVVLTFGILLDAFHLPSFA